MLLAQAAHCAPASGRCEKADQGFKEKWWGRDVPLQPDPRKEEFPRGSPGADMAASIGGLVLDKGNSTSLAPDISCALITFTTRSRDNALSCQRSTLRRSRSLPCGRGGTYVGVQRWQEKRRRALCSGVTGLGASTEQPFAYTCA